MTCSRFYVAFWPHVISRMRSFTFWFWSSCDFIWDQRVLSRAKNEANAFQRGKKKQGWLAKTNDARVFPASLAWLPCFSLRSDCLPCIFVSLYLVVRAKISFSLSRHIAILQVVTHRCAYYRAEPTCLRKKIKVLQVCGILCVIGQSRVKKKPKEMLVQPHH